MSQRFPMALPSNWGIDQSCHAECRITSEYTELFPPNPLYAEMSGLCPRIDYRLQWGNDGEVLVHLLTFFRLRAPPVAQQCRL